MGKIIKFGPSGLGGVKEAIHNLENFNKIGLKACEIAFTHGIYLKKKDAINISKTIKDLNMSISIHAQYWVNLNSNEEKKITATKQRILNCCEIAHYLGAKRVVFHPGFYGKKTPLETFEKIKQGILEMQKAIKEKKYNIELCPETMGKINVFGSIEEISKLVKQTGCGFCIDLAHVLARYKDYKFNLLKKSFPQKTWHCHFSGIEYGEKGEKRHKLTTEKDWKTVLKNLPKNKDITIINESPDPVGDSILGLKILKEIN